MRDPMRLLEGGGLAAELALLRAAHAEEPAPESRRQLLFVLGLVGGLPAGVASSHHGLAARDVATSHRGVPSHDAVASHAGAPSADGAASHGDLSTSESMSTSAHGGIASQGGPAVHGGAATQQGMVALDAMQAQRGVGPPGEVATYEPLSAPRTPVRPARGEIRPANDARAPELAWSDAVRAFESAADGVGGTSRAVGLGAKLGAKLLLVIGSGLVIGWFPVAYFDLRPPLWGARQRESAAVSGMDVPAAPAATGQRGAAAEPPFPPLASAAQAEAATSEGPGTPPSTIGDPPAQPIAAPSEAEPEARARAAPSLAREVAQLDRARGLLAAGRPWIALRAIDQYARDFPAGVLSQESTLLRLEAMLLAKQPVRARELAAQFLREHPGTPHRDRIRALLAEGRAH